MTTLIIKTASRAAACSDTDCRYFSSMQVFYWSNTIDSSTISLSVDSQLSVIIVQQIQNKSL